ncbi:MAG: DUF4457 domain-containing protein [Phycisphaerae bacterium]
MSKKLIYLVSFVLVLAVAVPLCSAAIGPITSITTDNPTGSPPYNILSITVGSYTVTADRLATGTTTHGGIGGTLCPEMDDWDINTALNWRLGGGNYWTVNFGGGLWKDSNGDDPDFFLFESGGEAGDDPDIAPIFFDGTVGTAIDIPGSNWGPTGYLRDQAAANDTVEMDGQQLHGISFAITDLLDASGNPLTNDTVILGLWISDRGGADPVGFFAVVPPPVQAKNPHPADKATDVVRDVVLSWVPGESAKTHDVYFGTNFDDVSNASGKSTPGVEVSQGQDANMYDPAGLLTFSQTYYWRVDEVNNMNPESPWKGEVWSFMAEPVSYPIANITATASSAESNQEPENTVNGSGLDDSGLLHRNESDNNMWLTSLTGAQPTWIQYEFDKVYKLHQMWVWNYNESWEPAIGVGFKDVTIEYSANGTDYTQLGTTHEFAQAPGADGYAYNTTIDLGGVTAKYVRLTANSNFGGILNQYGLSEVRFFHIPVVAREPDPASGATDMGVGNVALSWRAGREASSHNVYFSTDQQAVIDETVSPVSVPAGSSFASYDTGPLDLAQTYYWNVVEVNEAETPATWQGDVWNFSTQEYLVVDDFEDYNDFEPDRIFDTWIDGWGVPTNGSQVGSDVPPFAEQTIVHGGKQSMPLNYDNTTASYSEATANVADLAVGSDWTKHGIKALTLYFYGDPTNTVAEQMYVKINGSKVVYGGSANELKQGMWKRWSIDLASFGVNLSNVTELSIGLERTGAVGAKGIVFFDDSRLCPSITEPAEEILLEAEAAEIMGASWRIYDDPGASGGRYIGSEDGDGDDTSNPPGAEWLATYNFTVSAGIYKIQARIITAPGNSFWVRIPDATSPQITRDDGWVNTNPMDEGSTWHWDEIHNDQQDDNVVYFRLSAGQHTLEIAKREDGALLDSILITSEVGLD